MKKTMATFLTGLAVLLAATSDCMANKAYNLPPAQRLMEPGPGVGGPGPGVLGPMATRGGGGGINPAMAMGMGMGGGPGCGPMGGGCAPMGAGVTSQIAFLGVEGGEVAWDVSGQGLFDSTPLVMPGRQNFSQGAIYRIKLTNLPDREGVELYPTLEVAPVTPRTDAFLAHAPIPIQFSDEDLDQVLSGNFVTKVIYLPDPEFQDLALAGVETLVSTRLDPGVDPIAEADRRGSIMAILRIGNLDLQLPGQGIAMNGGVTRAQFSEGSGSRGFEGTMGPVEAPTPAPYQGETIVNEGYPSQGDDSYPGEVINEGYQGETINEGYQGESYQGEVSQGEVYQGEVSQEAPYEGGYADNYGGGNYGGGYGAPRGMSTSNFAPRPMPPHMVSGMNMPQWGMPSVGTPIGLPGPPHIPLGHQAGLTKHSMRNRTKVRMPPPVHHMKMTVKQRPGMNYPRPVNHVNISENNRAGFRAQGGTMAPAIPMAMKKMAARLQDGKARLQGGLQGRQGCPSGNCQ